jgi:hypothetical protein
VVLVELERQLCARLDDLVPSGFSSAEVAVRAAGEDVGVGVFCCGIVVRILTKDNGNISPRLIVYRTCLASVTRAVLNRTADYSQSSGQSSFMLHFSPALTYSFRRHVPHLDRDLHRAHIGSYLGMPTISLK